MADEAVVSIAHHARPVTRMGHMGVALLTRDQSGMAFVGMESHDSLHRQEDDQEQSRKVAPDVVARVHFGGKNTTFSHQKATRQPIFLQGDIVQKKRVTLQHL